MLFKEIIGQEQIKKQLIQTVKENRISHAQLFAGPPGVGKLPLAIAYAQYINCKNRSEDDACGVCPSCIKYEKLIHPDLHFIYPVASTKEVKKARSADFIEKWRSVLLENGAYIGVNQWYEKIGIENKQGIINAEDCNSIIKTLGYKSYEAEYKVMVIWMADKLFHAAAPKILKILEEPPEKTLFLLISENQGKMISTILSRTQIVKVPKINELVLLQALKHKGDLTDNELLNHIHQADGNYNLSLELMRNADSNKWNFTKFQDWMRMCFTGDVAQISGFVSEFAKIGRERQKNFFSNALQIARNCMLINYGQTAMAKSNEEELEWLQKFSPFINAANIETFTKEFNEAHYAIERNANPSILLMDISLKTIKLLKLKPA